MRRRIRLAPAARHGAAGDSPDSIRADRFFYDGPEDARPWRLASQPAQLFHLVGQGFLVLETDPGSRLGDFGPVLMGPTGDVSPMRLHVVSDIE